jgi:hypothetical protein
MANEQTRGTTDFATQTTTDTGSDMKGRAREAVNTVKERAGERIESRIVDSKTRAADTLSGVASSLHSSSEQLRDQQPGASRAIERAAEGVERFASYLQETNVDDVVESVHEFARRQPAAFIGGAFALGFIASRFLKATSPDGYRRNLPATTSDYGRGYSASYDTARGYGNTGDTSGSLGYGAGLSTTAGGTTDGGYSTTGRSGTTDGAGITDNTGTTGTTRSRDDLGDGSPGLGRTGGNNAGSR